MNKDTALRLALDAFEYTGLKWPQVEEAITAIKAALEAKDEPVVWNEGVPAMLPKQKEGETFIVSYEPKLEAKDERHIPIEPWAIREEQVCPKKVCWYPYDCEDGRCVEAENNVFLSKAYQKEKNCE